MTRSAGSRSLRVAALLLAVGSAPRAVPVPAAAQGEQWEPLFDGKTLSGWEGNEEYFRVQDGAIVGGTTAARVPRNEFLCRSEALRDFALRLQFRMDPRVNSGVQIRARRIPGSHEVIGYQADLGDGYWAALYDESRRNRVLAKPPAGVAEGVLVRDGWNQYDVYANGRRVRILLNGRLTVDYVEPDTTLEQTGHLCLQIHSGPPGTVSFRDIRLMKIAPRPEAPIAPPSPIVRFRKHLLTPDFIAEGVATADVDRDGDVDLLAGPYWFEAPTWRTHLIRAPRAFAPHRGYSDAFPSFALDVNRDGWPDVIQFDFPGREAYWYENPGRSAGHWRRRVVHPSAMSESPRLEDVNGDGRGDLLFVERTGGRLVWVEAPSRRGDTTWTVHPISAPMPEARVRRLAHGLGFDDVNGDRRRDAFTPDAWWEAPARPGGPWIEHPADLGAPAAQMYAYDMDGDGDRDVVASSAHAYGLWWYEQGRAADGAPTWTRHTIDGRLSQMHALAVADLDGDRVPDLITGDRFFAHNGNDSGELAPSVLLWYRGGRDAAGRPTWTPYLIDEDAGVGLHLVLQDVTGDGRADIVTASKKGVFIFEREN